MFRLFLIVLIIWYFIAISPTPQHENSQKEVAGMLTFIRSVQ